MENTIRFLKGFGFTLLLFLLYFLLIPNLLAIFLYKELNSSNFWIHNLAYLSIYVISFILILLIVHKEVFKEWKEFLKSPKKILNTGISYWVYGIIVMMISNLIISSIIGNIAVNEQETRNVLLSSPLYAIPAIIFFGPFLEEIIFRFSLRKAFQKEIPYAITSALIFGGIHVATAFSIDGFTLSSFLSHAKEILYIIPYGSLGYFFAKSYYETENIFSSIIPHMLHNTFSILLIFITNFMGG